MVDQKQAIGGDAVSTLQEFLKFSWLQSVLGVPFGERQLPMFLADGAAQSWVLRSSVMSASAIAHTMATSDGSGHYGPVHNRMRGQHFRRLRLVVSGWGSRNPVAGGFTISVPADGAGGLDLR